MRKWKIKPFTLFLILFSLLFLIIYPIWIGKLALQPPHYGQAQTGLPSWSGIITLWDIPYVQAGRGSHLQWLNGCINRFEKEYPGVFIDVRTMTVERLNMYLYGNIDRDILPDIISLGIYDQTIPENLLTDLSTIFTQDELAAIREPALNRVQYRGHVVGVPYMMGCYGIYLNQEALWNEIEFESKISDEPVIDYEMMDYIARKNTFYKESGRQGANYYGFCTYVSSDSKPLLCMIYQEDGKIRNTDAYHMLRGWVEDEQDILPPNVESSSYSSAFKLFALDGRAAMMLGSSRVLYDIRKLQASGRGVECKVYPLPGEGESALYMDQVAAYGVLNQADENKKELCILFLKSLLREEAQNRLKDIGMFSILKGLQLYEEDKEMLVLEQSLDRVAAGPWGEDYKPAENLLNELLGGNNEIDTQ